jgi:hypothetical protein
MKSAIVIEFSIVKRIQRASLLVGTVLLCCILSGCDPHKPLDHPCNFPDAETQNNLRSPWTYKIIDKVTFENLVDTTKTAVIHADSVVLMDENLQRLPFGYNRQEAYRYYIDNWIFDNLFPYNGMPGSWDDPQAYLNLEHRTFYLRTAYNDLDTIDIYFEQCLINPPILFNGRTTEEPDNEPNEGYASFYFKK